MRARGPVVRAGRPSLLGAAARTAVVAGTATAVSGNVARRQAMRAQAAAEQEPPAAAPLAPPHSAEPDSAAERIEQLKQLAELRDQGVLTDDEFAAEKARILRG